MRLCVSRQQASRSAKPDTAPVSQPGAQSCLISSPAGWAIPLAALAPHATIDDFAVPGSDFQLLQDSPGKGFVVGAVGRFWQPRLEFVHVAPHDFAEPGYGKIVWGLTVDKRRSGGSWVTFELRLTTTDQASEEAFDRYWAFVLEAIGDEACWLGARVRADYEPSVDFAVRHGWEALVHQALQRTQLQNLKARAEQWKLTS